MRIHKLIPLLALLIVLPLTTISTFKNRFVAVEPGTASAQPAAKDKTNVKAQPGTTALPAAETKVEQQCDLYLDAAEVERRAKEEQSGSVSLASTSPSRVPISFEDVAVPLVGGIDHAVAGVGTRNSGKGVIRLRGVPPGAQLIGAVLIWGEITNQLTSYSMGFGSITTSPATFTGNVYGVTQEPCWHNEDGQYAGYITNVTSAIAPGINGDYLVTGLRSAVTDNRCPWMDTGCVNPSNDLVMSEGASLIVFFAAECIPLDSQIYVHLGPQMFNGLHTVTHSTLPPIAPGPSFVKHSRIGADGQVSWTSGAFGLEFNPTCGLHSSPEPSDERTWIINALGSSIQIKGDGAVRNRDSDWNGYDGEPMNKLWDTHSDVIQDHNLAGGGGLNYTVKYQSHGDCIVWAAHILGIR
ncbi:MAG TPA: hypothetical protein VF290_27325 [Pyrinomonadaceae bacterium]